MANNLDFEKMINRSGYGRFVWAAAVIIAMLSVFLVVYTPHYNYSYPLHIDEWHHITEAIKLGKGEYDWASPFSLEIGFHLFLMVLGKMINLVQFYRFLPSIFAAFAAFAVYHLVKSLTGSDIAGLISMIFLASIESNVNIMGLWFFTPLTMAIPLLYLLFIKLHDVLDYMPESIGSDSNEQTICRQRKSLAYAGILFAIIFFVHPATALFAVPVVLLHLLATRGHNARHWKVIVGYLAVMLLLGFAVFFRFFWKGTLLETGQYMASYAVFVKGWGIFEQTIYFSEIINPLLILLAVVGLLRLRHRTIMVYWVVIALILKLMFDVVGWTVLVPYQRLVYYAVLGLVPLSGAGLMFILQKIEAIIKRKGLNQISVLTTLILLFVGLTIMTIYSGYGQIDDDVDIYHLISEKDYDALVFLKTQAKGLVMAPPDTGAAVYAISGHDPVGTIYFYGKRNVVNDFYRATGCKEKNEILADRSVRYIITENRVKCGWTLIYEEGPYVYESSFG